MNDPDYAWRADLDGPRPSGPQPRRHRRAAVWGYLFLCGLVVAVWVLR